MSRQRLPPSAYTVAWICALPIESAAAVKMLDEEHDGHGNNVDQYVFGRIGQHNIVMARLPSGQMGNSPAAAVIARLTAIFSSVRFALMVGIGGGVPSAVSDIRLGDVVIGHPYLQHSGVVQYDFGKMEINNQITRTGALNPPPKILLNAIAKLRENRYLNLSTLSTHLAVFDQLQEFKRMRDDSDFLFNSAYNHHGGETCNNCDRRMIIKRAKRQSEEVVIHYGTIASGNLVMKDGETRDRISRELGGVLCFEMEAAGLAITFPCMIIRGICDYADSHKNKSWQPYAAATAAAAAKELLLIIPEGDLAKSHIAARITDFKKYQIPFNLKGIPRGRFVDRPDEMIRLEKVLLPQLGGCRQKVLVLHGLGGIGKTQLAAEFVRKHKAVFTSIFWLDGSSKDNLKQSIVDSANHVPERTVPESINGDLDAIIRDFIEWLSIIDNQHWLIIFDNVDRDYQQQEIDTDAYDISNYIPEVDHGSVLITTRLANLQQLGESLHLRTVNINQARAIFQKWYDPDFDMNNSEELFQLLDGLPLALAQAAAYMNETGASFSTYTRLYKEQWRNLMKNGDTILLKSYGNRSIATTWMVSYNAIQAKNKSATNLLLLSSHLNNRILPYWVFQTIINQSSILTKELYQWFAEAVNSEVGFLQLIRLLQNYGLVESLQESSAYRTHPVVHQWAFYIQDKCEKAALSRLAILILGNNTSDKNANNYHEAQRELLPQVESWIEKVDKIIVEPEVAIDMKIPDALHRTGVLLYYRGNLEKAEQMYRRALEGYEKAWGRDHTSTLDTINSLGSLYKNQGKLVEAEQMYRRALEGKEKAWGYDHISTLDTINSLGNLYANQKKLVEAEKMYRRALEGKEKAWGHDHTSTLGTVNNLGNLFKNQGKLVEAEEMYRRALEGKEKSWGHDHTSTLGIVNNLGNLYANQGKLMEAEEMYQRALEGYEKAWGRDHISTLDIVNNLGVLYADQGKLVEAEKMYRRVLEGREKAWGCDHISTLNTINNLGVLYKNQGKLVEAEEMHRRALEGYEKALGPEDIMRFVPALNNAYNYGMLLEDQGQLISAKQMYTRALNGYKLVYGTDYKWYQATQERLKNLETTQHGSPTTTSQRKSRSFLASKRLTFLRKFKFR